MGEKRGAVEEEVVEVGKGSRDAKKVKKVAEMVLVLAAMGKMRGGGKPSEAERGLMAEAREKLAEVCEVFAPKDVFPRESFGGVIEDLGLNKLKEQHRLGFRPPKVTIAEKFKLSRRKFQMDKSENFIRSPTIGSQRMQGSSGTAVESHGTPHPARVVPLERPTHAPISSAHFQPAALGHVAATNLTLPYQLPASEVRPIVSNPFPSSHAVMDSSATFARVDRPHFRMDGRSNGFSHTSQAQVQAHSSGNHTTARTLTWSAHHQSVSSSRMASDNNVPIHATKVEGAAITSAVPSQPATSQPSATWTAVGNPPIPSQNLQGTGVSQAPPMRHTHAEISKMVQLWLQPQHPEWPTWTPPSRSYMSRALTCQICKSASTEVENVLICDYCEKGFHLQCLQNINQKGPIKVDWHCGRCLSLSNGKPIPPKYGRVMRNTSAAKVSSQTTSVRPSPDRISGTVDGKVNQQKITDNGSIQNQNAPTSSAGNINSQPTSESKLVNAIGMQGKEFLSGRGELDYKISSVTHPNYTSSFGHVTSSANSSFGELIEEKKPDVSKLNALVNSRTAPGTFYSSPTPGNQQNKEQAGQPKSEELPSSQSLQHHCMVNNSIEPSGGENFKCNLVDGPKRYEQGVVQVNPAETPTTTSGNKEIAKSPNGSYIVMWVGNVLQVLDGKMYYQCCCINGVAYKVRDHVLVRFDDGKLVPSKLQAMWEDSRTKTKWVSVNRCYFPSDLPETVGCPGGLESDEVYESVCSSTIMAGLIEGPCEVLPPNKFAAEKNRRARIGTGMVEGSSPCYLCKWIYDESKGLFRDISC